MPTTAVVESEHDLAAQFVEFVLKDRCFDQYEEYPGFGHIYDAMCMALSTRSFRGMGYQEFSANGLSLGLGSAGMNHMGKLAPCLWNNRKRGLR